MLKWFQYSKKRFFAFEWLQKPIKHENSCGVAPSENKKSYGGEPSEKKIGVFLHRRKQYCNQIETNKNGFNMVKKGFNMVLKGFIAFGWLKNQWF